MGGAPGHGETGCRPLEGFRFIMGYGLLLHEGFVIVLVLCIPTAQSTPILDNIVCVPLHSLFILPAFHVVVFAKDIEIARIEALDQLVHTLFRSPGTRRLFSVTSTS